MKDLLRICNKKFLELTYTGPELHKIGSRLIPTLAKSEILLGQFLTKIKSITAKFSRVFLTCSVIIIDVQSQCLSSCAYTSPASGSYTPELPRRPTPLKFPRTEILAAALPIANLTSFCKSWPPYTENIPHKFLYFISTKCLLQQLLAVFCQKTYIIELSLDFSRMSLKYSLYRC